MKLVDKLYTTSIRDVVHNLKGRWLDRFFAGNTGKVLNNTFQPIDKNFLSSDEYENLMNKHIPYGKTYDLHEAQNNTKNYVFRHHSVQGKLGIFRWRGIYQNKEFLLEVLSTNKGSVIDFGGAACPLGLNSEIVDFLEVDAWGRTVPYRHIGDVEKQIKVIFSSHTLEHIEPLEEVIRDIHDKLDPNGLFVLHLPSFYCERWRAGRHNDKLFSNHVWTFGLSGTEVPSNMDRYVEIDTVLAQYFSLEKNEYCGDDSIFIVARKATVQGECGKP